MKIAYLIEGEFNLEKPTSVVKKVLRQVQFWSNEGHSVWVFSMQSGSCFNVETGECHQFAKTYDHHTSAIKKLFYIYWNSLCIYRFLKKTSIDLVYSRLVMYTPFVEAMARAYPTIIEINSYDKSEYTGTSYSQFTRLYTSLVGDRFKKQASGFVFVTHELEKLFRHEMEFLPISRVIGNGYDYSVMPQFDATEENLNRPRLVFVISPNQPWHGVDKLKLIAEKMPEYDFQVIGEEGIAERNVEFSGYLSGDELSQSLLKADFGVGTLALDRKNMQEACPLKSREYLYHGLPCFGFYSDPDFMILSKTQLPLFKSLSNIHDIECTVEQIREFVNFWRLRTPYKQIVHQSAKGLLDDSIKESKRLKFFTEVFEIRK